MTANLPLLFGLDRGDRLLHISQVRKGRKCACRCPECGASLEAIKRGKKKHYFEHFFVGNCSGGTEMALRNYAIQLMRRYGKLRLPEVGGKKGGRSFVLQSSRVFASAPMEEESVFNEELMDLLLTDQAGKGLAVCFKKKRGKKRRRLRELVKLGLEAVEIDLEEILQKIITIRQDFPGPEDIANGIVNGLGQRNWLLSRDVKSFEFWRREEGAPKLVKIISKRKFPLFPVMHCPDPDQHHPGRILDRKTGKFATLNFASLKFDCMRCPHRVALEYDKQWPGIPGAAERPLRVICGYHLEQTG